MPDLSDNEVLQKSEKGQRALARAVSANYLGIRLLAEVDGYTTVGEIIARMGASKDAVKLTLGLLLDDGYVTLAEIGPNFPTESVPRTAEDDDLDFTHFFQPFPRLKAGTT